MEIKFCLTANQTQVPNMQQQKSGKNREKNFIF